MNAIKSIVFFIAIGCAIVVYAHSTFVSKDFASLIVHRLDRIEQKLDNFISKY